MEPLLKKIVPEENTVISPFAETQSIVSPNSSRSTRLMVTIFFAVLMVIGGLIGGVFVTKYINDPYRILEKFSTAKYLDDYKSLAGSKYQVILRVEADLGWKDETGRLMLFSTDDDSRPICVFIPFSVDKNIYFSKGQSYKAAIEVKEGGLVYANSCEKD